MQATFRNPKEIPFVMLPEAAKMIKVKIEAKGSSAYFRKRKVWDNEGQMIHQSVKEIDKPWDELAERRMDDQYCSGEQVFP